MSCRSAVRTLKVEERARERGWRPRKCCRVGEGGGDERYLFPIPLAGVLVPLQLQLLRLCLYRFAARCCLLFLLLPAPLIDSALDSMDSASAQPGRCPCETACRAAPAPFRTAHCIPLRKAPCIPVRYPVSVCFCSLSPGPPY